MSNSLQFEKKDLLNILTALQLTENQVREQQLQTIHAGDQMGVEVSALTEYYSKRLALIERNKKNIQWLIDTVKELKENGVSGDAVAVLSVREKN